MSKKHTRGFFSQKEWTISDVDALFDDKEKGKAFRKMAIRAAQKLYGERSIDLAEARNLAHEMVRTSTAAGRRLGKYPHPGALLTWIAEGNPNNFMGEANADDSQFAAMITAIFANHFRGPSRMTNSWAKFLRKIRVPDGIMPFFMRRKVRAFPARTGGGQMGLRLRSMKVRFPVRPVLTENGVRPASYVTRTIDFTHPENESRFGVVMLGLSADGKSMWIASEKGHGVRAADVLTGKGSSSSTSGAPGRFTTLYPNDDNTIKAKLPEWFQKLSREKVLPSGDRIGDTLV